MDALRVKTFLLSSFEEARRKNPAVSLRSYARRLKLHPSTLSRILAGKRPITRKLADRICDQLHLDPKERAAFLLGRDGEQDLELSADQFRMISDWQHYATLSLMQTKGFVFKAEYISKRLGVSLKVAKETLIRLKKLELIQKNERNQWTRIPKKIKTPDGIANLALQKAHFKNLSMATDALSNVPVSLRDFTSITMPTDPALLELARKKIRKFQDELSSLLESVPGTEVYRMCIQLFPLTHVNVKGEESGK